MAYTVHNFEQGDVLYAEQLNEMDAQIAANEENIENSVSLNMLAENYSANKTYSIGDYVIYNNELYTCIYEITAPEGWNSTHWRIASLGDGIGNLNHEMNYVEDSKNITDFIQGELKLLTWNNTYGYVSSTTRMANNVPIKFPYPIRVYPTTDTTLSGCIVRTWSSVPPSSSNLLTTNSYNLVSDVIIIPANTYFTVEFSKSNQATITLDADKTKMFYVRYSLEYKNINDIVGTDIALTTTAKTDHGAINELNANIGNEALETRGSTLKAGINDTWNSIEYVADDLELNDYLQNLFVSFRWNDTYGYVTNQTAMSITSCQKLPYDVMITNIHYPDFLGIIVRTFSNIISSPANLINTITYSTYGDNAVSSIVLPKDVYWTVQFTRPNNVNIDLATYKVIPHFIAGNSIKMQSQLSLNNTLVVGKKMAQYTRIQDAVDSANSGDTILILPGTYEEAVSAWGKEVHLIGVDRDSTIIIEKSGLYSTPTLEINIGSVRNLTLIETGEGSSWGDDGGKGRAYTVHIENGEGYTGVGELWFDNCKLINYAHAAVGCGLYQDLHVHFNNCYMYSGRASDVLDDYYRGTFYYHTCVAENISGQRMTVKDCEIINEGTKAFFGGVATPGATTGNVRSTFINNNFYAMSAETQNVNAIAIEYSILNYHDCKLTGNSRGNNIPVLNAP